MKQLPLWKDFPAEIRTSTVRTDKRSKGQLLPFPRIMDKPLKRGTKVCARHDITFADGEIIPALTPGKIVTSGEIACNVHFEGHSAYAVLCLWDMLLAVRA